VREGRSRVDMGNRVRRQGSHEEKRGRGVRREKKIRSGNQNRTKYERANSYKFLSLTSQKLVKFYFCGRGGLREGCEKLALRADCGGWVARNWRETGAPGGLWRLGGEKLARNWRETGEKLARIWRETSEKLAAFLLKRWNFTRGIKHVAA